VNQLSCVWLSIVCDSSPVGRAVDDKSRSSCVSKLLAGALWRKLVISTTLLVRSYVRWCVGGEGENCSPRRYVFVLNAQSLNYDLSKILAYSIP
jgi:hypothetical protein